jgi:hypothetical protein
VLLGDMNVPNMTDNEATLKALENFDWKSVEFYSKDQTATTESLSRIGGSNLGNDKTYDQIAFSPSNLKNRVISIGYLISTPWFLLTSGNRYRLTALRKRRLRSLISTSGTICQIIALSGLN